MSLASETVYVSKYLINMGPGDVREPGSLVPEFETWSHTVKNAHLSRGRIEKMTRGQWEKLYPKKTASPPAPTDVTIKTVKNSKPKPKKRTATKTVKAVEEVIRDDVELQRESQ